MVGKSPMSLCSLYLKENEIQRKTNATPFSCRVGLLLAAYGLGAMQIMQCAMVPSDLGYDLSDMT